ncbi:19854_t:CDS:2 [Funneliformis geosporum]|uniref:3079_t:CDS:1 n=1 Tax=Funneliformis geosporum TaxID=1117311 RepID=A0A9W4SPW0_9GLOM|nr:19854_t:CDS:2 [Funneliformis geosporum]CAI2177283.1 3079_t:CDS:2 [Funneliformis geosporum]
MLPLRKTRWAPAQHRVNSLFSKKINSTVNSNFTTNIVTEPSLKKGTPLILSSKSPSPSPSQTKRLPHRKIITNNKQWNYEEDNILLRRVIRYGWKHWGIISQGFPNRSSSDCYYRYRNNLKYLIDYSFICSTNQSSLISLTSKEQKSFWKKLNKLNNNLQLMQDNNRLKTKSISLLKQYYINMQRFSNEQQQLFPINYNLVLHTSKKIKDNNKEESLFVIKNKPWTSEEIERLKDLLLNDASLENQLLFTYSGGKNVMYNWKLITSKYFPNRTPSDVRNKWHNIQIKFPWTKQEDQIIADGVKQFGEQDHITRSPKQCMVRWRDTLKPLQSKQKIFSEYEHLILEKALKEVPLLKGNKINWKYIHQHYLPNRTPIQLYKHYYNVICKPAKWSLQEDELLLKFIKEYQSSHLGDYDNDIWKQIAKRIPGRTAIQCRNRYLNKLDPSLKKGCYTVEDQFKLFTSIKKHGRRWSLVAKELGRSKVSIAKIFSLWKYRNQFTYARKRKGGMNSIYGKLLRQLN